MKFIIEHLEEEISNWTLAEYRKISQTVGKQNLIFTNVKKDSDKLKNSGEIKKESVLDLQLNNSCLLDPLAEKTLTSSEAKRFDYFIFGGILGDNPPRKRTQELTKLNCEKRNLGEKQMSTDTAAEAVYLIINGKELEQINFIDEPEIEIKKNESVILPYRYISENGKPKMSKEIIKILESDEF